MTDNLSNEYFSKETIHSDGVKSTNVNEDGCNKDDDELKILKQDLRNLIGNCLFEEVYDIINSNVKYLINSII